MRSRLLVGLIALAFVGVLFWQASGAGYSGPGGRFPWGPGTMGGYGFGMNPGMMGGYGYEWGPWMMGRGMMVHGPGMMGWAWRGRQANLNLTPEDVRSYLQFLLAANGNSHIKVGNVTEKDADTITADIVTTDKEGLVQRYAIDRRTGFFQPEGG